jgi:hypothetical protein
MRIDNPVSTAVLDAPLHASSTQASAPAQPPLRFAAAERSRSASVSVLSRLLACLGGPARTARATGAAGMPSADGSPGPTRTRALRLGSLANLRAAVRSRAQGPRHFADARAAGMSPERAQAAGARHAGLAAAGADSARGGQVRASAPHGAASSSATGAASTTPAPAHATGGEDVWHLMRSHDPKNFWKNLELGQRFTASAADRIPVFADIVLHEVAASARADSVLPHLSASAAKAMRPILSAAMQHLAKSPQLDSLDTSERGRLIALIRHPDLKLPIDAYLFQERGTIDRNVAARHAEMAQSYVDAIANDPSIRHHFAAEGGVSRLPVGAKEELTEKLVAHAAKAMGLREPVYASYSAQRSADHELAAAVTFMGPPSRLVLTRDIFDKGPAFLLNTVLHEMEHVRQFNIDRAVGKEPLFAKPPSVLRAGSGTEAAGMRYYNLAMKEGDKRPAEDLYDHRYGRENERHAWALGLGAALLAQRTGLTAPTPVAAQIDIAGHAGDVWSAARSHFEGVMGMSVKSLATLIPTGRSEAAPVDSGAAWDAIVRLTQHHDATDKAGTLGVALLSGAPEISRLAQRSDAPRDASQCASLLERAVRYALQSPDGHTVAQKLRDDFFPIFPKTPIRSEPELAMFLDKVATLSKNNCKSEFVRQVLFQAASLSVPDAGTSRAEDATPHDRLRQAVWPA